MGAAMADNSDGVMTLSYFKHLMGQEPLDRKTGYQVTGIDDQGVLDGDMITSALIPDTDQFNDAITILYGVDFEVSAEHEYKLTIGSCGNGTPLCRVQGMQGPYQVIGDDGHPLSEEELAQHATSEFCPNLFDSFDLRGAVVGDVYPKSWLPQ